MEGLGRLIDIRKAVDAGASVDADADADAGSSRLCIMSQLEPPAYSVDPFGDLRLADVGQPVRVCGRAGGIGEDFRDVDVGDLESRGEGGGGETGKDSDVPGTGQDMSQSVFLADVQGKRAKTRGREPCSLTVESFIFIHLSGCEGSARWYTVKGREQAQASAFSFRGERD